MLPTGSASVVVIEDRFPGRDDPTKGGPFG